MAHADDSITTLAEQLVGCVALVDDAARQPHAPPPRPAIVRLAARPGGHGIGLGLSPIDAPYESATDALLGFVAPRHWHAVGAANEVVLGDAPVRIVHVVHRSGAAAWSVGPAGPVGTADERGAAIDAPGASATASPAHRLLDDACRRSLLLPTAAPAGATTELWAVLWLDAIVSRAAVEPTWSPRWAEVAALHPAAALGSDGASPRELLVHAHLLARTRPWEHLRRACAAGEWPVPFLPAATAAWMDDGMFSRWVLAGFPAIADLAAALADLLPASTAALATTVAACSAVRP